MRNVRKNALLPYTAAQMFALVDDIESYPKFLPWCKSAQVRSRSADEVRAQLEIAHGGFNKAFSTCNRVQANKMIEMRLLEGPFKHLEGFWRFDDLNGAGCKISFDLEFKFSNTLMDMAFGPVFSQIANTLVDAFCQRAKVVYG